MKHAVFAIAAIALLSTGCRTTSLGPDTGVAYRKAFAAQSTSKSKGSELSAEDARNIRRAHYNGPRSSQSKGSQPAGGGMLLSPAPIATMSSSSAQTASADSGGIQLRAK